MKADGVDRGIPFSVHDVHQHGVAIMLNKDAAKALINWSLITGITYFTIKKKNFIKLRGTKETASASEYSSEAILRTC